MMAEVLSDYIKSREEFERFCNIFLKKEVSPRVKVYNAPGPDGGIDAEYCGPYDGKNGCWIFQCKFYDPTSTAVPTMVKMGAGFSNVNSMIQRIKVRRVAI